MNQDSTVYQQLVEELLRAGKKYQLPISSKPLKAGELQKLKIAAKTLNNKISFSQIIKKNKFPTPKSFSLENFIPAYLRGNLSGKFVIQKSLSYGARETYFISKKQDLQYFLKKCFLITKDQYLVRHFTEGTSLGVELFINQNCVYLSAPRVQCFISGNGSLKRQFVGLQWLKPIFFSKEVLANLSNTLVSLGKVVNKLGFFSSLNVDLIITNQNKPLLLEANARFTAGTPHLLLVPQLSSLQNIYSFYSNPLSPGANPCQQKFPDSNFEGSVLFLKNIKKKLKKAIYGLNTSKVIFITNKLTSLVTTKTNAFIF
jgi:hypothetical protein